MKIDPSMIHSLTAVQPLQHKSTVPVADAAPSTASSVVLSPEAVKIQEQISEMSAALSFDHARVEAAKLAIAQGHYEIRTDDIARALLQDAQEKMASQS